jgi:hypothetical protein
MKTSKLSLIALCLSILALMLCFYLLFSERRFDADWGQIITGILSFLVTILIAWQIWTVIDTKDIVKELREENKNLLFNIQNDAHNQAAAVYSSLCLFCLKDGTNTFECFFYGLLATSRFIKAKNYDGAIAKIKTLNESFPVSRTIRNTQKVQLLQLVAQMEQIPITHNLDGYAELKKNIESIPSNDNA